MIYQPATNKGTYQYPLAPNILIVAINLLAIDVLSNIFQKNLIVKQSIASIKLICICRLLIIKQHPNINVFYQYILFSTYQFTITISRTLKFILFSQK